MSGSSCAARTDVEVLEVVGQEALDRPVAPGTHRQLAGGEQLIVVCAFDSRRNLVHMHQVMDEIGCLEHLRIVQIRIGPVVGQLVVPFVSNQGVRPK